MENIPIWAQALILVALLLASAFFSMTEDGDDGDQPAAPAPSGSQR